MVVLTVPVRTDGRAVGVDGRVDCTRVHASMHVRTHQERVTALVYSVFIHHQVRNSDEIVLRPTLRSPLCMRTGAPPLARLTR